MGGGYYSQDVAQSTRSTPRGAFARPSAATQAAALRTTHAALSPHGSVREVNNETPIVVALDVTRSRGDDTKLMYDKLPMLMGQIELHGYVSNPGISFAAIGDATCDQAPLQVGQFEGDNRLDEMLERIWIEEGGGGTGQESYELCAWYYARTDCVRLREGGGRKGYFFFVGDEGFYPNVDRSQVEAITGEVLPADVPTTEAFRRLQEKFHVFLIFPSKTFEERKADIDAEIRQRVMKAGGQYDDVDIRASLLWNNRNDLDLHVITPGGEEISFSNKQSSCGGWLDVDCNVQGQTVKPVENIRWAKGKAKAGRYRVIVQNYRFWERSHAPTQFKVELAVGGEIQHIKGVISPNGQTGDASNVLVRDFKYDPSRKRAPKPPKTEGNEYSQYSDEVILAQWATVIPREHILRVSDPKSIVDVILGALALSAGATDLDRYRRDMQSRHHGEDRVERVARALAPLARPRARGEVEGAVPTGGANVQRGGRSRRL